MHKRLVAFICFLLLASAVFLLLPIPTVHAQSTTITTMSPSSGKVGQNITLQGTIGTENGNYQIRFNNNLLVTNTSVLYAVNAIFTVPDIPSGDYNVTLTDSTSGNNATVTFTVLIGYSIEPVLPSSPALLQEGSTVQLNVTITGGLSSTSYDANISVVLPSPLNTNYSQITSLSTNANGTANTIVNFSNNTSYTGTYLVYFNQSDSLASSEFTIGFTEASQYHRNQIVTINAIGYPASEVGVLTIKNTSTNTIVLSRTVTASSSGIFSETWTVPPDALIGNYNITITPQTTNKSIPDTQIFSISGYSIQVRALNLAGQIVPSIDISALDLATNTTYNATTGSNGIADLNLETGNHTITAYRLDKQVGQLNQSITGIATYNLTCQLANINVTVKNTDGALMQSVNLTLTCQYTSSKDGSTLNATVQGKTDRFGNYVFNSTFTQMSYTINASVYGKVFNVNSNTIPSLPSQPIFDVNIICPTQNLKLTIIGSTSAPIINASLTLIELTSGMFQNATTNNDGTTTMNVTFGLYQLRVYSGNILLNQTLVEVFGDSQTTIQCSRYGIQVTVSVVDFFGQPISFAIVTLYDSGNEQLSGVTSSSGTATFINLIGGNMQVVAYLPGMENNYQAKSMTIDGSTTVQVKMGQFISLGPFIIGTNAFAALVLILASILLFFVIKIFWRKKMAAAVKT